MTEQQARRIVYALEMFVPNVGDPNKEQIFKDQNFIGERYCKLMYEGVTSSWLEAHMQARVDWLLSLEEQSE